MQHHNNDDLKKFEKINEIDKFTIYDMDDCDNGKNNLEKSTIIENDHYENELNFKFFCINLLPNIASSSYFFVLSILERYFTARENPELVTGVALGNIFSTFICYYIGYPLVQSIAINGSKYFGTKNFYFIGQTRNLIAIMIFFLCLFYSIIAILFSKHLLKFFTKQPYLIYQISSQYIKNTVPKIFFELECLVFISYFESHLIYTPTWVCLISGLFLYPLFATLFINRLKMGQLGAALAFIIDNFIKLSILLIYNFFFNPYPKSNVWVDSNTFDWIHVKKTLKISFENVVSMFSEAFGYFLILIFASRLEKNEYSLFVLLESFILLNSSFSSGWMQTNLFLIGNYVGEKRADLVRRTILYNYISIILFYLPYMLLIFIFKKNILKIFSDNQNIMIFENLSLLLTLMVIFLILEFIFEMNSGILKGLGEIKFTSIVNFLFLFIIDPILTYILMFVFDLKIFGIFIGLISVYFTLNAIYLIYYYFFVDIDDICKNYLKNNLILNSESDDKEE